MEKKIVLSIKKPLKIMSYLGSLILAFFLFLALVEALESGGNPILLWGNVLILFSVGLVLPLIIHHQKIIITESEVQSKILFTTKKVSLDELVEVNFMGMFSVPKIGDNILNIDTRYDNRKQALDFFEGKVDISGAEKVK